MGSLAMHLVSSYKIKDKYDTLGDNFIVGVLAPDILKKITSRDETHFMEDTINIVGDPATLPNLDKYIMNHIDCMDAYHLGYLCHLIQDKLWFEKYIPSVTKLIDDNTVEYFCDNSLHSFDDYHKDIYADYSKIDNYLLNIYHFDIAKIRKDIIEYFRKDEITKIVNKEIILYNFDEKRENRLIDFKLANEYIEEAIEQSIAILNTLYK